MMMQGAARSSLTLVALFALGLGSILGYTYARRDDTPAPSQRRAAPTVSRPAQDVVAPLAADAPPPSADRSAKAEELPSEDQLLADALGQDFAKKDAAFATLAKMPKSKALPVLRHIITSGDEPRRLLALHSLRTFALSQGDADGAIRNAVRDAIYHGDSDEVANEAQTVLDDVESAVSAGKSSR